MTLTRYGQTALSKVSNSKALKKDNVNKKSIVINDNNSNNSNNDNNRKIEAFLNVTRMEEKKVLSKNFVFSRQKLLRQVHSYQKGEHSRGAGGNAPTSHGGVHHIALLVRDNKSIHEIHGNLSSFHL